MSKHPNPHDAFLDIVKAIKKALPENELAAIPAAAPIATHATPSLPRSSNLRVKRSFTDEDKDQFIADSFEYVARFFEGSMQELAERNTGITSKYRSVDANRFTATLYRQGQEISSCTVWFGSRSGLGGGINYCNGINLVGNTYNESFSVEDTGYALFLSGMGFTADSNQQFGEHGAAEHLWNMFIERLQ